jgi:hypothetical protein
MVVPLINGMVCGTLRRTPVRRKSHPASFPLRRDSGGIATTGNAPAFVIVTLAHDPAKWEPVRR